MKKLFFRSTMLLGLFVLLLAGVAGAQKPKVLITKTMPINATIASPDELYFSKGTFLIRTSSDYRYLTIKDGTPRIQSLVSMWSYLNRANRQTWKLIPKPGGYYKIQSESGFFLSQKRLIAPTVEAESAEDSQLWQIKETGDGYYSLISKTNKYLGVTDRRKRNEGMAGFSGSFQNNPEFKWQLIKWTDDGRKMTPFTPESNGFNFDNTFQGVDASYRYGGLCGGMVYTSLDYYHSKKAIPLQRYRPANRTPLQSYIFGRQNNSSLESNLDRWIEMRADALGTRNSEFFEWGLRGYNGGRLEELQREINDNKPAPLGLYSGMTTSLNGYKTGDHQVLAIGYALGRYTGNMQGHPGDMKIFLYNPNNNNKTMTLVPDMMNKCFFEVESGNCWRTYFVDSKYSVKYNPPDVSALNANEPDGRIRHIYVAFQTGADDLRGGNDNVQLTVNYKDGSKQHFNNINGGARWVDNYEETVPLVLNREVSKTDITSFTITTTFGGGFDGDNWNLDKFYVTNGGDVTIVCANCERDAPKPMVRFTGSTKTYTVFVK